MNNIFSTATNDSDSSAWAWVQNLCPCIRKAELCIIVVIYSKISIIGVNCSQRLPDTVSKETLKDTRCGTATPHRPQGEVEHVIAKQGWKQTNRRKEE